MKSDDITLADGKSGQTSSPGIIYSGGMGPCIAVGIYDVKKRCGYMIHVSNADSSDEVENFLEKTLKKSKLTDLKVYLAGGGIDWNEEDDDPENINESIKSCRHHVRDLVTARFDRSQYIIDWNDTSRGVSLVLHTETGEFEIEADPDLNDDLD